MALRGKGSRPALATRHHQCALGVAVWRKAVITGLTSWMDGMEKMLMGLMDLKVKVNLEDLRP